MVRDCVGEADREGAGTVGIAWITRMALLREQIGRGGVDRAVAGVWAEISEGRRRALHGQQIAGTSFHGEQIRRGMAAPAFHGEQSAGMAWLRRCAWRFWSGVGLPWRAERGDGMAARVCVEVLEWRRPSMESRA
jgi:hypothetical protein